MFPLPEPRLEGLLGEYLSVPFLRVEYVPYTEQYVNVLRTHVRGDFSQAETESKDLFRTLSQSEQQQYLNRSLTAFHEALHFHQFCLTTGCRTLWDIEFTILLSLRRGNPYDATRVLVDNADYILLRSAPPIESVRRYNDRWGVARLQTPRFGGDYPVFLQQGRAFPLGALALLEGWAFAHCLALMVAHLKALDLDQDWFGWYVGQKDDVKLWPYWLLLHALDAVTGESLFPIADLDVFEFVSRVAFFGLQIAPTFDPEQYLRDPGNVPAMRVYHLLRHMESVDSRIWRSRERVDHLLMLMTQIEEKFGWHDHRAAFIPTPLVPEQPASGSPHEGKSVWTWAQTTFRKYQSAVAAVFNENPATFLRPLEWNEAWRELRLPRPPMTINEPPSTGSSRKRQFTHFLSVEEMNLAVHWLVLTNILKRKAANRPLTCLFADLDVAWECSTPGNRCYTENPDVRSCCPLEIVQRALADPTGAAFSASDGTRIVI